MEFSFGLVLYRPHQPGLKRSIREVMGSNHGSQIANLVFFFRRFTRTVESNTGTLPQIRQWKLPSTISPVQFAPLNLLLYIIQPQTLCHCLSQKQIKNRVSNPSRWKYIALYNVEIGRDRLCGLWSGFISTDPEVRVRFPVLPDFLRSSGSGTGSTQPLEYN
jgi:hypothetical protein